MGQAPEGWRGVEEELFEASPKLSANQAVEHRVEAAVGVCQTHGQGEGVGLHIVEGLAEGHEVKLYQHPPQCERLIGEPAEKERQNHNDNRFGHSGTAVLPALLHLGARCTCDTPAED